MDFDPDGIGILSTYKHGSRRLSHENGHLNVPGIQWLGIKSDDFRSNREGDDAGSGAEMGLLRLSVRDRKRAINMLDKDGWDMEWRREMQVMLMLNVKAEMEILNRREGGMETWLEGKLIGEKKKACSIADDVDFTQPS
jgi:meiotic recombination protein SPO11